MFGKRNYYFNFSLRNSLLFDTQKEQFATKNNGRKCFWLEIETIERHQPNMIIGIAWRRWGHTKLNSIHGTFLVACKCAVNCCHCSAKFSKIHFIENLKKKFNINKWIERGSQHSRPITKSFSRTYKWNDDSVSAMATIVLNILLFRRSHMATCTIVTLHFEANALTNTNTAHILVDLSWNNQKF